jgi:acyl-coenzyme A synthetase/AMP-(fatty) acid ligase
MNDIFLVDKNIISYQDVIDFLNEDKTFNNLSEVESFIFDFLKKILNKNVLLEKILNFEDLIIRIKNSSYRIILKTSGTTGKPKEIYHTIDSITKNIIVDNKYSYSIWGMCYPVGKMAFYQVFFQSIFNKSKLINLYGYSFEEIESKITENNITNLSATPTFYKMLISGNKIFNSVKLVTLGGEGVEEKFINKLKNNNTNSTIKNIYATS